MLGACSVRLDEYARSVHIDGGQRAESQVLVAPLRRGAGRVPEVVATFEAGPNRALEDGLVAQPRQAAVATQRAPDLLDGDVVSFNFTGMRSPSKTSGRGIGGPGGVDEQPVERVVEVPVVVRCW